MSNANTVQIDPVLTTEAARILEVSPETIRHWERIGTLPAIKTRSGARVFNRSDLFALKRSREAREQQRAAVAV